MVFGSFYSLSSGVSFLLWTLATFPGLFLLTWAMQGIHRVPGSPSWPGLSPKVEFLQVCGILTFTSLLAVVGLGVFLTQPLERGSCQDTGPGIESQFI